VRLSSWRDEICVSGEWREADYETGVVERVLVDVVELLGLLAAEGDIQE
jgi:hypothetical protein